MNTATGLALAIGCVGVAFIFFSTILLDRLERRR